MINKLFGALAALVLVSAAVPAAFASDALPGNAAAPMLWDSTGYFIERTPSVFKNASATVITSETTIWTPATGKKFRLMGYCVSQGVATGAITLKDNTAGTTILVIPQNTVGGTTCNSLRNGILSAAANNVLTATGASTETVTGYFYGTEE